MKQLMKPSAILGVAAMMLASCNQAPKAVENKKAEPKTETKEMKITNFAKNSPRSWNKKGKTSNAPSVKKNKP